MRNPIFATLVICSMLLSACGRVDFTPQASETQAMQMSQDEALDTLMEVPVENGGRNLRGRFSALSGQELVRLIQELIASGKIKVNTQGRNAAAGGVDLSQLTNIFSLLQGGKAGSIMGLAQGLVGMAGSASGAGSGLGALMGILNAALPFIAVIAPQYAPIITALTTILPIVVSFIGMFRRPKTQTTNSSTSAAVIALRFAVLA